MRKWKWKMKTQIRNKNEKHARDKEAKNKGKNNYIVDVDERRCTWKQHPDKENVDADKKSLKSLMVLINLNWMWSSFSWG